MTCRRCSRPPACTLATSATRDNVGVGAGACDLGDLAVAEAGDAEEEILALALRELGKTLQCSAGFDDVVDRDPVGDHGVPSLAVVEVLEVRAAFSSAEAVGLVDG